MSLQSRVSPPLRRSSCRHTVIKAWGIFLDEPHTNLSNTSSEDEVVIEKYNRVYKNDDDVIVYDDTDDSINNTKKNECHEGKRRNRKGKRHKTISGIVSNKHFCLQNSRRKLLHPFLITKREHSQEQVNNNRYEQNKRSQEQQYKQKLERQQEERWRGRRKNSGVQMEQEQMHTPVKHINDTSVITTHDRNNALGIKDANKMENVPNGIDDLSPVVFSSINCSTLTSLTTPARVTDISRKLMEKEEELEHGSKLQRCSTSSERQNYCYYQSNVNDKSNMLTAPSSTSSVSSSSSSSSSSSLSLNDTTFISTNPQISPFTTADNTIIVANDDNNNNNNNNHNNNNDNVNSTNATIETNSINPHLHTISPEINDAPTVFDTLYAQEHERQVMPHTAKVYSQDTLHQNIENEEVMERYANQIRAISPAMSDFLFGISTEQVRAGAYRNTTPLSIQSFLSSPHGNFDGNNNKNEEKQKQQEEEYALSANRNWHVPLLSPNTLANAINDGYNINRRNVFASNKTNSITRRQSTPAAFIQKIYKHKNPYQHVKSVIQQYRNNRYSQLEATFALARQQQGNKRHTITEGLLSHHYYKYNTLNNNNDKYNFYNNKKSEKIMKNAFANASSTSKNINTPFCYGGERERVSNKTIIQHSSQSSTPHSPEARKPHRVRYFSLPEPPSFEWITKYNKQTNNAKGNNNTHIPQLREQQQQQQQQEKLEKRRSASLPSAIKMQRKDYVADEQSSTCSYTSFEPYSTTLSDTSQRQSNKGKSKNKMLDKVVKEKTTKHCKNREKNNKKRNKNKNKNKNKMKKVIVTRSHTKATGANAQGNGNVNMGKKQTTLEIATNFTTVINNKFHNCDVRTDLGRRATVPLVPHCAYVIPERYLPEKPIHFEHFTRTKSCHQFTPRPNVLAKQPQSARELPRWARNTASTEIISTDKSRKKERRSSSSSCNNNNNNNNNNITHNIVSSSYSINAKKQQQELEEEEQKELSSTPLRKKGKQYSRVSTQPFVPRASQEQDKIFAHLRDYRMPSSLSSPRSSNRQEYSSEQVEVENVNTNNNNDNNKNKNVIDDISEEELNHKPSLNINNIRGESYNKEHTHKETKKQRSKKKNQKINKNTNSEYNNVRNRQDYLHERHEQPKAEKLNFQKTKFVPNFVLVEKRYTNLRDNTQNLKKTPSPWQNKKPKLPQQRHEEEEEEQELEEEQQYTNAEGNVNEMACNSSQFSPSLSHANIIINAIHYTQNNKTNYLIKKQRTSELWETPLEYTIHEIAPLSCRNKLVFDVDAPALIHTSPVH